MCLSVCMFVVLCLFVIQFGCHGCSLCVCLLVYFVVCQFCFSLVYLHIGLPTIYVFVFKNFCIQDCVYVSVY